MPEEPNYHSFLHYFAPKMDKVLDRFRTESSREDIKLNWLLTLFLLIIKDFKTFYKPFSKIGHVNLTGIPFLGGVIAIGISWFFKLNFLWILAIALITITIFLLCLAPFYRNKMLNIYHPFFHLPAYKKFRPHEYELLNHTVVDKHFSYTGLKEYVNGVLSNIRDHASVVEIVTNQYNEQKEELKGEIEKLKEQEKEVRSTLSSEIERLDQELEWSETVITYLVEFIQDIYVVMHRMASGVFSFSDLKLISGFTIYQLEKDELIRISDEGTTGQTPPSLSLNRKFYNPWVQTIIDSSKDKKQLQLYNNQPKEGYEIVSFRMFLKKRKKTWIFSLQIHKSTNPKGFILALSDDIIDKTIVYDILYGLCMILDDKLEEKQKNGVVTKYGKKIE